MGFRTKLILSYAIIIFLTLALAIALFSFLVQQTQQSERAKTEQGFQRTGQTVARLVNRIRSGVDIEAYKNNIYPFALIANVRILLVAETGEVVIDTAESPDDLSGQKLNYKLVPRDNMTHRGNITLNNVNNLYYAVPGPLLQVTDSSGNSSPTILSSDILVTVPEAQLAFNWGSFLQGLAVAVVVALLASIGAAYFVARTIAKPLIKMTIASEAIAQGNYDQKLESAGKGEDEISRLALSFNRMSHEVARSHQTMRDFVANVSHELKTPLTSIQGFSQAILDGTADDRVLVEHSLTVINNEAARMRRLVDELLDLSRIESGQIEFRWQEISLPQLLERVVSKLEPLASQKRVTLVPYLAAYANQLQELEIVPGKRYLKGLPELAIPPATDGAAGPIVRGDADRLEQVFTNILDNAIKYSQEGTDVKVELRFAPAEECVLPPSPGNPVPSQVQSFWTVTSISNLGPLIPSEQLPRIFERFYKLDKSRAKKKGDSTGLGLAIARELLEAHQGTVQVQSEPVVTSGYYPYPVPINEALTTFRIYLPLLAVAPTPGYSNLPTPVYRNQA